MRKIELKLELELANKSTFEIIDLTDGVSKTRGKITVDYTLNDVRKLADSGLSYDEILSHYEARIYGLVKYYISGDWESVDSNKSVMDVIAKHVRIQYDKL